MKYSWNKRGKIIDELIKAKVIDDLGNQNLRLNDKFAYSMAENWAKNENQRPSSLIMFSLIKHFGKLHEKKLEEYWRCVEALYSVERNSENPNLV